WLSAFVQRLRERGWSEGQNVKIDVHWAEGRFERLAQIAADLAALHVDVFVTSGGGLPAAKKATSIIPIVFVGPLDPVGSGYVDSLARPGGNATGLSLQWTDLVGKRLELLREVLPAITRLGTIGPRGSPGVTAETAELRTRARKLGIDVVTFELER